MTETPEPLKAKKQRRRRRHMTRRTLVKILPVAAARLEALLHDEKEVGLALEMRVINEGTTNTYLPAIQDVLLAVVKEQQWEFVKEVDAWWFDCSASKRPNVSGKPHARQLTCQIDLYDNTSYDPRNDGGLELEVLPTSLRLHFAQFENAEVTVACPQLILDRILSGQ